MTGPETDSGLKITQRSEEVEEGLILLHLHFESEEERIFPPVTYRILVPSSEIRYLWNPKIHLIKALNLDWFLGLKKTSGFTGAPVQCLIGAGDENRAVLGLSDVQSTLEFWTYPVEETAEYAFELKLFEEEAVSRKAYDIALRLDMRQIPYYEALKEMSDWWAGQECSRPAAVPAAAREPMYSTWYSFHQEVGEEALLNQCRLSKEYGCRTLLLDDGWQTDDSGRGYTYCGDWEPAQSKIPDMKGFVERVHGLGMKVVTWYSVPFIGVKSRNFERFKDMLIDPADERGWHVLDPRYPEVREFIVSLYEKALEEWDFDGFKLDFVDEFVVTTFSGEKEDPRRDFISFAEAADCLMKECIRRLKARKPDILLEFRQTYNGPLMRSYGNIFRAVDCPLGDLENRLRVTDIRLLAGNSAVHSDMLMWHTEDTPESAAMQIIGVLFSVPQISMRLDCLREEHKKMLAFYCGLWKQYQDAFINGTFEPGNPSGRYSVIRGSYGKRLVCTYFAEEVIRVDRSWEEMVYVNGSGGNRLYLAGDGGTLGYEAAVYDCMGNQTFAGTVRLSDGVTDIPVPVSGAVVMKQAGDTGC